MSEEKLFELETKVKHLNNIVNTLTMSLSDVTQRGAEMGMHLAALLKTIQDDRPLDGANLAKSSVQNMVDKLDNYIKLALDRGFLKPISVVDENSVVAVKQLDGEGNEVVRKMLLNIFEQDEDVKQAFKGSKVTELVKATGSGGQVNQFVVLEIYEPTEALTEEVK